MHNSVMLLTFFFTWKTFFRSVSSKKVKIISLSWNLIIRIIWICRIQRRGSLFFIFYHKYPCLANLVQKIKIVTLTLIRLGFWRVVFPGMGGGQFDSTPSPPSSLHISKRTYLISIKLYKIIKQLVISC